MSLECNVRSVDYASLTVRNDSTVSELVEALGVEFGDPLGFGRFQYRNSVRAKAGGINIFYDGTSEMGVHIQISGEGCRLLEARSGFESWAEFFRSWLAKGATFGRVDLAVDDRQNIASYATVRRAVFETRSCVRRGNRAKEIMDDYGDGKQLRTLYVGSRQSTVMLRCYERGKMLGERDFLRFECEFKEEKAQVVAVLLSLGNWDDAFGMIRGSFEFKDESHKTCDRTRQRAASWWVKIIEASRYRCNLGEFVDRNLKKAEKWLDNQVLPTLAMLATVHGWEWLYKKLPAGMFRMNQRHDMIVARSGSKDRRDWAGWNAAVAAT